MGKAFMAIYQTLPAWFAPTLVELNEHYENFEKACYLTKAKDLFNAVTPGHTLRALFGCI